jgi:UDP-N-acetylglucosamine/UDP-N-acetylgalactosamine diphosphorylase
MSTPALIEEFRAAGQSQVFAYWDELSPSEQEQLLAQASEVDLSEVAVLTSTLLGSEPAAALDFQRLVPAPYEPLPRSGGDAAQWAKAVEVGEDALRAGRVAAFTVAGGQGTRLGYDGPKGTFPVTPVKNKSLFQVFAEKIRAVTVRYGRPMHWFIMTSHQNHEATESFFQQNNFFGLDENYIHFFRQGRMPAVNFEGKILLDSKSSIALSPDGHGGSLRGLERSGALDIMEKEGIDILSYFQVDNPLVRFIDPAFIGWHILSGSEMSSKMIPKAYAEEKLGHFCLLDGRLVVVEYSDLPMEMQQQTDPETGQLKFLAGSIAIHMLGRDFVRRMASGTQSLPFHRADKKVATIDAAGNPYKPEKINAVKFELFVFDALPFAGKPLVIETSRDDEFAPVKNAEGNDSPRTCKENQLRQFTRWCNAHEAGLAVDETGLPEITFEVSPLFGYDEASFADSWKASEPTPQIKEGTYLE